MTRCVSFFSRESKAFSGTEATPICEMYLLKEKERFHIEEYKSTEVL